MSTTPRASAHALVAHLDGEVVLLHADTKDYFRLNETGQAIWRRVERGDDVEAILASVVAQYDVEPDAARAEITRLLAELHAAGLLTWTS